MPKSNSKPVTKVFITTTNIGDGSTGALTSLHFNLDLAIKGDDRYILPKGMTVVAAKRYKLAVRDELIRRAENGDQIAERYAQKRKWLGLASLAIAS